MLRLLGFRHAETNRNRSVEDAANGNDAEHTRLLRENDEAGWVLTEKGLKEAEALRQWFQSEFKDQTIKFYYTSWLTRAMQTGSVALPTSHAIEDARLQERYWGDFRKQLEEGFTTQNYLDQVRQCGNWGFRSTGVNAQSFEDIYYVVQDFVFDLIDAYAGEEGRIIPISSHGGALKMFQMVMEHVPPVEEAYNQMPKRLHHNCGILDYKLYDFSEDRRLWKGEVRVLDPTSEHTVIQDWVPF